MCNFWAMIPCFVSHSNAAHKKKIKKNTVLENVSDGIMFLGNFSANYTKVFSKFDSYE